jgi:ribosome-binding factor A
VSHTRARMGRELRDWIARILELEAGDPRLRQVSVVEVRPSPDLSFARVFYRTLGDPDEAAQALAKAKPFLRRRLASVLRVRRVPELDLRLDPTPEVAARIDTLLADVARDDDERDRSLAPQADAEGERGEAGAGGDAADVDAEAHAGQAGENEDAVGADATAGGDSGTPSPTAAVRGAERTEPL